MGFAGAVLVVQAGAVKALEPGAQRRGDLQLLAGDDDVVEGELEVVVMGSGVGQRL